LSGIVLVIVRNPGLPTGAIGAMRPEFQFPERVTPFDIKVWDVEGFVQMLELCMEALVLLVLPEVGGRVAEKHPAAKRADGVNRAKAL
jgi:hypothetical protein